MVRINTEMMLGVAIRARLSRRAVMKGTGVGGVCP